MRLARIFCDDRDAAEDLVQEAFVRLHRSAASIRDPERAPAFLRSIVLNLARDHNRRGLMKLRHRSRIEAAHAGQHLTGIEDDAVARALDPALIDALRRLPERQRTCLALRYFLELSEAETAATLGLSTSSVKTHVRRGLAALEAELHLGGEDPR